MITKNIENCQLVIGQIMNYPETWDQKQWHCETSHCFAGWAQVLAGKPANNDTVRQDARQFLGLTLKEANYYFYGDRTLDELKTILNQDNYYDEDGYDKDGYDEDGYNDDGYDRNGYDRNGYDQEGYDRNGYDQEGYNSEGYDRDDMDRENNIKPQE